MYKQAVLVRQDLKLPKGKLAVQVAHASVECTLKADKETVKKWREEGMKKVVLKVNDLKELRKYHQLAKDMKLTTSLMTDAGLTTVEPGTITCIGIGPEKEEDVDKVTRELKLI